MIKKCFFRSELNVSGNRLYVAFPLAKKCMWNRRPHRTFLPGRMAHVMSKPLELSLPDCKHTDLSHFPSPTFIPYHLLIHIISYSPLRWIIHFLKARVLSAKQNWSYSWRGTSGLRRDRCSMDIREFIDSYLLSCWYVHIDQRVLQSSSCFPVSSYIHHPSLLASSSQRIEVCFKPVVVIVAVKRGCPLHWETLLSVANRVNLWYFGCRPGSWEYLQTLCFVICDTVVKSLHLSAT